MGGRFNVRPDLVWFRLSRLHRRCIFTDDRRLECLHFDERRANARCSRTSPLGSKSARWPCPPLGSRIAVSEYLVFPERLVEAGIEASVVSVGDAYDNTTAETINGLFKDEVVWRRGLWQDWEAVEHTTLE